MAFIVSVPSVADKEAVLVLSNAADESTAITIAENLIGYQILGLPYILTDVMDEEAERMGVQEGHASIITKGE